MLHVYICSAIQNSVVSPTKNNNLWTHIIQFLFSYLRNMVENVVYICASKSLLSLFLAKGRKQQTIHWIEHVWHKICLTDLFQTLTRYLKLILKVTRQLKHINMVENVVYLKQNICNTDHCISISSHCINNACSRAGIFSQICNSG